MFMKSAVAPVVVLFLAVFSRPMPATAGADYVDYSNWQAIDCVQIRSGVYNNGSWSSTHVEVLNPNSRLVIFDLIVFSSNGSRLGQWKWSLNPGASYDFQVQGSAARCSL